MASEFSYLNQKDSIELDADLMSEEGGFSVDQLMELAGLSVAAAVQKEFPISSHKRVAVFVGPGNNGGDGLVAARHLFHFGYSPWVCMPRVISSGIQPRLVRQLRQLDIDITETIPDHLADKCDVIVDSIFGYSFKGDIRAPYDAAIAAIKATEGRVSLVAVDIPSGWDVERGDTTGQGLQPNVLVSLSAPKLCARSLASGTVHYLGTECFCLNARLREFACLISCLVGGRFVPPSIVRKYKMKLPAYPGAEQIARL
jgi:NAD(P)H-hydrate epimerase